MLTTNTIGAECCGCGPGSSESSDSCSRTIRLRLEKACDPYPPIVGATVEARATVGGAVLDSRTTDASGEVVLTLPGPGSVEVYATVGGCEYLAGTVNMFGCGEEDLGTRRYCCNTVCVLVYDFESGESIEGATVQVINGGSNPTQLTGPGGIACFGDVAVSAVGVSAPGYYSRSTPAAWEHNCIPCGCYNGDVTFALIPKATYVASCVPTGCGAPACDTISRLGYVRRRLYATFNGPDEIFGTANGIAIPLDWVSGDAADGDCPVVWQGTVAGGGFMWCVTSERSCLPIPGNCNCNPWFEVDRTRVDFTTATVTLRAWSIDPDCDFAGFSDRRRLTLEFANNTASFPLDCCGEEVDENGCAVLQRRIVPGTYNAGSVGLRYFPTTVLSSVGLTSTCAAIPSAAYNNAFPCRWDSFGFGGGCATFRRDSFFLCGTRFDVPPIDLEGTFWRSYPCGVGGDVITANYQLLEV